MKRAPKLLVQTSFYMYMYMCLYTRPDDAMRQAVASFRVPSGTQPPLQFSQVETNLGAFHFKEECFSGVVRSIRIEEVCREPPERCACRIVELRTAPTRPRGATALVPPPPRWPPVCTVPVAHAKDLLSPPATMTTCVLDDSRNPARRSVPTTTDSLKVGREPSDHGDFLKRLEAAEERDVATSKLISGSASRASAARLQRSFKRRPVPVAEPTKLANSDPPPQLRLSEANLNARRVSDPSATGTTGAGIKSPSSTFRSFRSAGSGTLTVRKDGVHKLEVTVENQ